MVTDKQNTPRVLADHTKVGKKFIPPIVAKLGPLSEVGWVNELVPELVWLELLHRKYSLQVGAALASQLATAAANARQLKTKKWFALASAYGHLETAEQRTVLEQLETSAVLAPIRDALLPLPMFYPQCPLNFLFDAVPATDHKLQDEFEDIVESCFNKYDPVATFVQATAVYIAFRSDVLKVFKGLALANFPAIEKFPDSEESKRVAAAVRMAVLMLHRHFADTRSADWISCFWKRGLELAPCRL